MEMEQRSWVIEGLRGRARMVFPLFLFFLLPPVFNAAGTSSSQATTTRNDWGGVRGEGVGPIGVSSRWHITLPVKIAGKEEIIATVKLQIAR
jgi:hypothetical protein